MSELLDLRSAYAAAEREFWECFADAMEVTDPKRKVERLVEAVGLEAEVHACQDDIIEYCQRLRRGDWLTPIRRNMMMYDAMREIHGWGNLKKTWN